MAEFIVKSQEKGKQRSFLVNANTYEEATKITLGYLIKRNVHPSLISADYAIFPKAYYIKNGAIEI